MAEFKVFDEMIGQELVDVENNGNEELIFFIANGKKYKMYHRQDCCESVEIEDICGDLELLKGKIAEFEEVSDERDTEFGTETWTFYKIATDQSFVTIRWYGESNGYYSESVDFEEVE